MSKTECCCPSFDGTVCIAIRYNLEIEDVDEPCECYCHFLAKKRFGWNDGLDGYWPWDEDEGADFGDYDENLYFMGEYDEPPTNVANDHQVDATHCLFLGFAESKE
jgi:hypothetical protein